MERGRCLVVVVAIAASPACYSEPDAPFEPSTSATSTGTSSGPTGESSGSAEQAPESSTGAAPDTGSESTEGGSTGEQDCGAAPSFTSIRALAGPTDENFAGLDVDGAGNVVLAVEYDTALDLTALGGEAYTTAGLVDSVIIKLAPDGTLVWAQRLTGFGGDYAGNPRIKPDGDVIVSGTVALLAGGAELAGTPIVADGGAAFVANLDETTGVAEWIELFGLEGDGVPNPYAVSIDATGEFWLCGRHNGPFELGGDMVSHVGGLDAWVARFSATGVAQMARGFGGNGTEHALSIAADGDGGAFIVGRYTEAFTLGGDDLVAYGEDDVFVAHVGTLGTPNWARGFGSPGGESVPAIAADHDGAAYLVGGMKGPIDFGGGALAVDGEGDGFVVSLGADGAHRWSRSLGGAGDDAVHGVAFAADGDLLVGGSLGVGATDLGCGAVAGDVASGFAARLDSADGSTRWSVATGSSGGATGGIARELGAGFVQVGRFEGMASLDPTVQAIEQDVYVARWN